MSDDLVHIGPPAPAMTPPTLTRLAIRPPEGERRFLIVLDVDNDPTVITTGQGEALERVMNQCGEAVRAILRVAPENLKCTCAGLADSRGQPLRSASCAVHGREEYGT